MSRGVNTLPLIREPLRARRILLALMLVLAALIYLPGISGPYLFDDHTNLLQNDFVKVQRLDGDSLYHAAFSLESGPLLRPLAMLSFALNHYFAGGFDDSTSFKLTNLGIHIINGLLVFWLMRILFTRLNAIESGNAPATQRHVLLPAFLVALLWLVHPIQLTSVLYVVQRMTSLSALFTFLGMIIYLKGRTKQIRGQPGGFFLMFAGLVGGVSLGILAKETALLLPVYILILDYILFAEEKPWSDWKQIPAVKRRMLLFGGGVMALAALAWAVNHVLPGYENRPFTLTERLFTEARALFFYLSLILVPRLDQFALHHDDFALSTSLFTPWTTLPAVIGVIGLPVTAILLRKRWPLMSLGILWFFGGHLLESSFIPLELVHEHRNYVASAGVLLAFVSLFTLSGQKTGIRGSWILLPVFALFLATTTYMRAGQWSTLNSIYGFEALHHPGSASANYHLGILLSEAGRYDEAESALRRAAELEPREPSHLIWLQMNAARQGKAIDAATETKLIKLFAEGQLTPTMIKALEQVVTCLQDQCARLRAPFEAWIRAVLRREKGIDESYYRNLLGRALEYQDHRVEAIQSYKRSHELDPAYLHPLFSLASIYVRSGNVQQAENILLELRQANRHNLHPRDREIAIVEQDIQRLKAKLEAERPRQR